MDPREREPVGDGQPERARDLGREVPEYLERHERALMQYTARITRDVERARDVVQEAFLRFWKLRPEGDDAALRAWLYTVCRNLALDGRRKERPMQALERGEELPDAQPSASEQLEHHQTRAEIMGALAALPPAQEEVIRLKFQGGLSYKEISEVTQHSVSYVGVLIHMGMKTLRAKLAEGGAR